MTADATDRSGPDGPGDAAASRLASDEGRLGDFAPGAILRAVREAQAAGDERLASGLLLHLSDEAVRRLRRKVDRMLPDGGRELMEAAHFKIMEAIVDPASADGRAMIDNLRVEADVLDGASSPRDRHRRAGQPIITRVMVPASGWWIQ